MTTQRTVTSDDTAAAREVTPETPGGAEEPHPRTPRMAEALGPLHYISNSVLSGPVNRGETILVPPGSTLEAQIDAGRASAVWAPDRDKVVACPGVREGAPCARPLLKTAVRASPVKSTAVYRALQTFTLRLRDRGFTYRTGERIDLEPSDLAAVVPGLLPGTVQRTSEVLYSVFCRHCGGVVHVPLVPGDE